MKWPLPGDVISIGASGPGTLRTLGVVESVYTDERGTSAQVRYIQARSTPVEETVVWKLDHWEFESMGPNGRNLGHAYARTLRDEISQGHRWNPDE